MAVSVWPPEFVLAGIDTVTTPLPVPLVGVLLKPDALQLHVAPDAITEIAAVAPPGPTGSVAGFKANEQPGPNCVIEYV